jgi:hypothetical protein
MKKVVLALASTLAVAVLLTAGGRAYATWSAWGTAQVPFYVNPQNADVTPEAAEAALQTAAAAWSTQSRATVSLYYAGRSTETAVTFDGKPTVMFRDVANGGTLATTYAWSSNGTIVDADIVFWDGGFVFFTGASGCVDGAYIEDVATHEFGHVLGLLHSTEFGATMYPYYNLCTTDARSLSPDDVAGIEALYPPASAPAVSIVNPLTGTSTTQGVPVSFIGSATDPQDGDVTPRIEWASNLDGPLGTGGSLVTPLSAGNHLVTARVTDTAGLTGSSEVAITVAPGCERATPTVTLAPTPVSVLAGMVQSYTINVINTDSSACAVSSFNMSRTAPAGWGATLAATSLSVSPGASASTTMNVTAPVGTPALSYSLVVTATNSAVSGYSGSGTATETVTADLAVTVSTDAAAYLRGNSVSMSVLVRQGSSPIASAKVTLTLTRPDGITQKWTPTTNGSGIARQSVKIANTWPRGTYMLSAVATKNAASGRGATSFVVN